MTRATSFGLNVILVLVAAWALAAFAWAGTTDRRVIENAARFFPIDRYEAAAKLKRLSVHGEAELRLWTRRAGDAGNIVAEGHVMRPIGVGSFWLFADGRGAVAFTSDLDPAMRGRFAALMAELGALEPIWGQCGWAAPDYEIEAVQDGQRLHFRFDRACAERTPALRRVVELLAGA